ncbi:g6f-like isoform X2 [Takifugu flavidus]|uniref:g6f-like isoform X2 n=1 Tax=Takifugu flavidus TaxID=433684 RepID=UPI00254430E0|nr:g6f-like isoform X2 [Takifugu flavidus]XP_056901989.1 g6f-like isoform X2 [Takifugu flavidus]
MEAVFFTFILIFSFAVYSFQANIREWDDVVVAREGIPTTLICTDTTVRNGVTINWKVKTIGADEWKLVLSASKTKELFGSASKASMRLIDPNFQNTGNFSLFFIPKVEDCGLYSCMIEQPERIPKETVILLAILTVTVVPAAPIRLLSTLRLIASVKPDSVPTNIIWVGPGGISMKSETKLNTGTVAKVPQIQKNDSGAYVCMVRPWSTSPNILFPFNVEVTVDVKSEASFTNITHGTVITTATRAQMPFTVICPGVQGDYVRLYWQPHSPQNMKRNVLQLYHYDRWRGITFVNNQSKRVHLAGPPYNADAGSFSFLFTPELNNGGQYSCDVFLNDNIYRQRTVLSVFKVKSKPSPSMLELSCLYSELSQIQSVKWTYQDKSRKLHVVSSGPGRITAVLPTPITADTAGNYTCTLQLNNGQTVWATESVALPSKESVTVTTPSLLPPLSALLLLVPLVAAAAGVLLWRREHISDRGIEESLSVQAHEAENIYENPEDIRQAPFEGSFYMDLKPRGDDGIYKELEQ